jgi:hypothetical protein
MFGRHTSTITKPDGTVVDERGERYVSSPDGTRAGTAPGRVYGTGPMPEGDQVVEDRTAAEQSANDRTETMPAGEPVAEPVTEPVAEPVADTKRWAHVSGLATLSLIIGTLAVAATLTGLLAPLGFAAGVLAILVGIIALYVVRRPGVTGHTLVGLGVLFGLVAIVLSVLAMNNSLSWLSSDTDQIATVHNWLNDHMHWLRRW